MEKKKIVVVTLIGILTLVILTIGATYAYFQFNSQNNFDTGVNIQSSTETTGTAVTITKVENSDLSLEVSAIDMMEENIGGTYYASGSSTPKVIGKITAAMPGTYNCTYTMTVTKSATSEENDLYNKFQNIVAADTLNTVFNDQVYLEVNGEKYDFFNDDLFPNNVLTINGGVAGVTTTDEKEITANLVIANTEADQTALNNGDINLAFEVADFNCELSNNSVFANKLLEDRPAGLNTTMEGGLYRFQGTNDTVDNYICFGTSDKDTCLSNTDVYMYRIIGIDENNQIKLIKKEALNETTQWHTENTDAITWPESLVYQNISGDKFLTNTTYVPDGWSDKIVDYNWKYGRIKSLSDKGSLRFSASDVYIKEASLTDIINVRVSLMYVHDYYYAYQSGGLNCSGVAQASTCLTSWIHLLNNDNTLPSQNSFEWTMTRNGMENMGALDVNYRGWVDSYGLTYSFSVRPVFFLTDSVQYLSGSGDLTDPFIVS